MRHFKSIEDIKNASFEELAKVPDINEKVARQIFDYFNPTEQ